MSDVRGISVLVHDACRNCGGNACFVDRGPPPLYNQLRCDACETTRGYVSKELRSFLEKFVRKHGWPDQPIILRSGKLHKPGQPAFAAETKPKRKPKGKTMKLS